MDIPPLSLVSDVEASEVMVEMMILFSSHYLKTPQDDLKQEVKSKEQLTNKIKFLRTVKMARYQNAIIPLAHNFRMVPTIIAKLTTST